MSGKEKIVNLINGCITLDHLDVAGKYLSLWKGMYDISSEDDELDRLMFSKKMKLKHGWDYKG